MKPKATILTVLGVLVALFGVLWLVQGLGIVQVAPLLCVADCEPVAGGSAGWTIAGLLAMLAGGFAIWIALYRPNR
jgi:hypothetical protein